MAAWSADELQRLSEAEEVRVAARRSDGSLRRPVVIWIVRVDDRLFVRSVRGPAGAWYQAATRTHDGHLSGGGLESDVRFVGGDRAIDEAVDAAYRSKYGTSSALGTVLTDGARATTTELVPVIRSAA